MNVSLIALLIAHSTPVRLPASSAPHRDERFWVVRLANDVSDAWNTNEAAARLTEKAVDSVNSAREATGLARDAPGDAPVVRLVPISSRHLVISIVTVRLEDDAANAYLVAASAALVALDEMNAVEDIQGLPRVCWRELIGPSEARAAR